MAKKSEIQIIISAVDKASKELGGVGNALQKLGQVGLIAGAAVAGIAAGIGLAAFSMAKDAAKVERTRKTWDNLAKSLGEAGGDIGSLRKATRGMVNDADLMYSSSKLMSMGLAKSNKEAARLLEISTQLGSAMGVDATQAAEDFALMLANQSIPRLDTFGISSGVVRNRIEELMAANSGMTRETAFMTATLEEAEKTLAKVGEQGVGAAADMDRMKVNIGNLKTAIGERFLPVLAVVSEKLVEAWNDPKIQAGIDNVLKWLEKVIGDENSGVVGIITKLFEGDIAGAFDLAFGKGTYAKIQNFANQFRIAMNAVGTAIRAVKTAVDTVIDAWKKLQDMGFIPGTSRDWTQDNQVSRWLRVGGGLASGGPVSAGKSYLVGERGPELFTPHISGNIIPNHRIGVGGMGLSLTVNINSAVNLADRAYAERELMPYIEAGVRQLLARAA